MLLPSLLYGVSLCTTSINDSATYSLHGLKLLIAGAEPQQQSLQAAGMDEGIATHMIGVQELS